ncbi:MAG: carbohydrate ABC transporter permease [Actinomycetota bacterium]
MAVREGVVVRQSIARKIGRYALLGFILLWCLFPFIWLIDTSLKLGDAALNSPRLTQGPFGFDNYISVFEQGFGYNLRNSAVVAGTTTIVCITVGSLAAYAIARLPLKGKVLILSGILAVALFPSVALVVPMYELWRSLGLLNTYPGLYVPYTAFNLPLTIFILTTFYASIPKDLEEAARVDGATAFQAFRKVVLPLAAPGVFAAAIIVFVGAWNEFLLASTFAPRDLAAQTVPVAIAAFTGSVEFQRPIGTITAACVIVTIPMIVLTLILQRRIVAGLTAGAVKG